MKINFLIKICLGVGLFLIGGALLVSAAGFVSYEDDNKIIVWDSVKMVGKGLRMTPDGVNDLKDVGDGKIEIIGKDLYLRSFMGFECPNYPDDSNCAIAIGNVGGSGLFLKAKIIKGDAATALTLNSAKGFILNNNGSKTTISGNVLLSNNKNLIITSGSLPSPVPSNTIFVDTLHAAKIGGLNNLELLDGLSFGAGAVFDPQRNIKLHITE